MSSCDGTFQMTADQGSIRLRGVHNHRVRKRDIVRCKWAIASTDNVSTKEAIAAEKAQEKKREKQREAEKAQERQDERDRRRKKKM